MTDTSQGGPADLPQEGHDAIAELDACWHDVERGLATHLSAMTDPDEGDHLILELPDFDPGSEDGVSPYAQFAGFGAGEMIRAEISGDAYLRPHYRLDADGASLLARMGWQGNDEVDPNWYVERPVTEASEVAHLVVWALRHHFGIAHPQLLTHRAWGPAAHGVGVLGLFATAEVPVDDPSSPGVADQLALSPVDRDDLTQMVATVLSETYRAEPTVDSDGDFELTHRGQPVWVRVRGDQPAVEIMARVAHGVRSRRATAVELGLLNRDNLWVRWTLRDRSVWQSLVLPGLPFVPSHLEAMLGVFLQVLSATRDDLVVRTGARVA